MNISIEEMPREIARLEDENERLNKNIKELEILVECLYLKVTLNQAQEELLNKIILGSEQE